MEQTLAAAPYLSLGGTLAATRIQVCGRIVAELDGRRIDPELPRQGKLLLVFLVVNRFRAVPRGELMEAIWERPPANVDSALSALLSKLRRVVALEGRSDLRLVLPDDAWVDLEAAADGIHRAEAAGARGAWADAYGPARVAQHVAVRGFLPGEDAAWVRETRERVETLYARALELVAEASLAIGGSELDTADRASRRLVERAPYRESGYRALMRSLDARGNRAEALRVYDALRTRLREDLGAAPSDETQALHRELLG